MKVIRIWKVYGEAGHRQRTSFESSSVYTNIKALTRVELYNFDRTGTHEYSVVKIFAHSEDECFNILIAHISDGIFENSKVGKIQEISESELQFILQNPYIKTGYEKVPEGDKYYCFTKTGDVNEFHQDGGLFDKDTYKIANYYSSKSVAEANNRADILYSQLRRFAVEHRDEKIDWNDKEQRKYSIRFSHGNKSFDICDSKGYQDFGQVYFDSEKTAQLAIDTFHDDLKWYFTEYRDSL